MMYFASVNSIFLIFVAILVISQQSYGNHTSTTTRHPANKNLGKDNAKNLLYQICLDEKTCRQSEHSFKQFIEFLEKKSPDRAKEYKKTLGLISDTLKKTGLGRKFISKYHLPENRAAEALVARHRSVIGTQKCKPQDCKCPLGDNMCGEGLKCPELPADGKTCAKAPKCPEQCKLITIPADDKRALRAVHKQASRMEGPKNIGEEMIDSMGDELNNVARQVGIAVLKIEGLEPKCNAQDNQGNCIEATGKKRFFFLFPIFAAIASALTTTTAVTAVATAATAAVVATPIIIDKVNEGKKLDYEHDLKNKERLDNLKLDKDDREERKEQARLDREHELKMDKMKQQGHMEPIHSVDGKKGSPSIKKLNQEINVDPTIVFAMREAISELMKVFELFQQSSKCPCEKKKCQANKQFWKCTGYCANNPLCNSHKCECPFEKRTNTNTTKAN